MTFRAIRVALLLSTLPLAGCGTVANLVKQRPDQGGVAPFGGVKEDMVCIQKAANGEFAFKGHSKSGAEQYPQRALVLFCAADLPFSAIGDVVTWPYTAVYSFINQPIPSPPVLVSNPPVTQPILPPPPTPDMPSMPYPAPPAGQAPAPLPIPIPVPPPPVGKP